MESPFPGAPPAEPSAQQQTQGPAGREGCARNVLIGCAVLALLVLAVVVGLFLYVRRNPALLTDLMMKQIESHYGPDVTGKDKADLRAAYQEFRTAVSERRVNREAVQRVQLTFSGSRSDRLSTEQVRALARAFRQAGSGGPPASQSPSVSPAPEPTRSP